MRTLYARQALLTDGWHRGIRLTIKDGLIARVDTETRPLPSDVSVDTLLPGMPNVHSHAFQRGFSGLAERRGTGRDSFWTWREIMYRFALSVTADDMQTLAEMAYIEMLEAGYTRVGEFHYLHHAVDGRPYDDPAEHSVRIFAAAHETGIALTHLPVFYRHGGFGPQDADDGQRRFLHDVDAFIALVAACDRLAVRPQDRVGYAPHSLRAVTGAELHALAEALPGRKVHIHIAEQTREVDDCLVFTGARPVEWLYDHAEVTADWCLIHATHLTETERQRVVSSRAVAGLCPVTEANLGDGLFPAEAFLTEGGAMALGTDSNIRIDLAEELRALEYGQRVTRHARNVLAPANGSTGARLFTSALAGGAQALDAPARGLEIGAPADMIALRDPLDLAQDGESMLDRWIFGRDVGVETVWAMGRAVVQDGRHVSRDTIRLRFAKVLRRILA